MRSTIVFGLVVVIASTTLVTTPVAAVTIDDFSADHGFKGVFQSPEPNSFLLLALGLTIVSGRRRKAC